VHLILFNDNNRLYNSWYSVIETLAKLHSVDYKAVGLADYGKQSNFYLRQIRSLQKVLAAQALAEDENGNKVGEVFRLNDMIAWFKRNEIPDETTIVHGDFKVKITKCASCVTDNEIDIAILLTGTLIEKMDNLVGRYFVFNIFRRIISIQSHNITLTCVIRYFIQLSRV